MTPRFPRLIMKMRLVTQRRLAADVRLLSFERVNGKPLPVPAPGAHVDFHLPNGHVNQYSLCGPLEEVDSYTIAVKKLPEGRGGSAWLHDELKMGDIALVSQPRNHFPLERVKPHTILLAAGIGITPIASMARALAAGPSTSSSARSPSQPTHGKYGACVEPASARSARSAPYSPRPERKWRIEINRGPRAAAPRRGKAIDRARRRNRGWRRFRGLGSARARARPAACAIPHRRRGQGRQRAARRQVAEGGFRGYRPFP